MPGSSQSVPSDALSDVAFLSRSENRLRILVALADTSATRRELEEETGIARATIGRALADFEDRGWVIESEGRQYEVTPSGAHIVSEFIPFLEAMAALRRLGDRVAWLPTNDVPIELCHFSDVTIRRPEPADPLSPAMSLTELLRDAAQFHCLVGVAPPLMFERAMREGVVAGELVTRHVITAEELSYLRDNPKRLARWREYIDAGGNVYRYDGDVPCNLLVFDETVIIGPHPRDGEPSGLVESQNETVHTWANEIISMYQRKSEHLESETLES